jgi:galactokinase
VSSRDDRSPRSIEERLTEVAAVFRERCGRAPEAIAQAPGRVNLIGEHLDYNDGLVLPVAIDRSILVAFARREDAEVRAYSVDFGEESTFRLGRQIQKAGQMPWSNYIRGICSMLTEACKSTSGLDLAVVGDIPLGAGLSSSAALEVATAGALRAAWQLDIDDKRLALLCQRAENEFVGVQCGVMDQLASALGRADHALLIDCRSLECEHIPLPLNEQGVALVVVDSGQRRRLEQSDYNRRREECAEALRLLRASKPEHSPAALRDVALDDLGGSLLPEMLLRRARHVVTEQRRVDCAVEALQTGDLARFGVLMNESHVSLREDFEVSTPELDRLVELAQAQRSVLGARLTGAGFGGCTVNLVREDAVDAFAVDVVERYASETKLSARMLVCGAADGLRVHRLE